MGRVPHLNNARDDRSRTERFADVIIGADLKTEQTINLFDTRRDHVASLVPALRVTIIDASTGSNHKLRDPSRTQTVAMPAR